MKILNLFGLLFSTSAFAVGVADGPLLTSEPQPGHLAKPELIAVKTDLSSLQLPAGFKVTLFAKEVGHPRMMVSDDDGVIYVSSPDDKKIYMLKKGANGAVVEKKELVTGYNRPCGLALDGRTLYFAALTQVYKINLGDQPFSKTAADFKPELVVDHLPDGGQHHNRTIHIGPDHQLYISIGSTCNSCGDANPENATMVRVGLDGLNRKSILKGTRDTMAYDWHPVTHELYGADHGVDWRGDEIPHEELNLMKEGKDYGWPYCYENQKPDTNLIDQPEHESKEAYCKHTEAPIDLFPAHSAPIDLKFYTGTQFPKEYQNSAFVTLHGSWNRKNPSGYEVMALHFEDGKYKSMKPFISGFLSKDGKAEFARPTGLLQLKDGSLLVAEDANGAIYQVSYSKQ